jgi:hypothetical protein
MHIYSPIGKCEQLFVRLGSAVSPVLERDSYLVDTSTAVCLLLYVKVFSQRLELCVWAAGRMAVDTNIVARKCSWILQGLLI